MVKPLFRLLTELSSRKALSKITGAFAKSGLSRPLIPWFAKTYGIPVEEAEKALADYASLNEFFTRRLKPGLRPVDPDPTALVSPVDAVVTALGPVRSGRLIPVKGHHYTVEELLNRSPRAVSYKDGFCFVLYLSPADYHRIHAPLAGTVAEKERVAGKAYPVNDFGMRHIAKVFSQNERLITYIDHPYGELAVVKVGAMNVSSIRYAEPLPERLQAGDELARFEFGSTVVLLTGGDALECRSGLAVGSRVKVGEALGYFRNQGR